MMALLLNANDSVSRSYSITKPSPLHPIVPSECGERTGNLFDGEYPGYAVGSTINYRPIYVGQGTFTLSTTFPQMEDYGDLFFLAGAVSSGASTGNDGVWSGRPITVESVDGYVTIAYRRFTASHPDLRNYQTMLNTGSTALPYEPYGYKLPLLSGSTPVDIYLGESQTTRQIKKLVLTGEESWTFSSGVFYTAVADIKSQGLRKTTFNCSHYELIDDGRAFADVTNNSIYTGAGASYGAYVYIFTDAYTTTTDFKAYLAQQYASGTPVTIWYPLKTETTSIVNEPLRKIGNYADTIDSTQTTAQIPTSANSTTISWAGQGVEPSQFDSIQEWVDIPTYKRVNGEWVEDN